MKTKISIARISTNQNVSFINQQNGKMQGVGDKYNAAYSTIACSNLSDNKTTYVQKKVWNIEMKNFIYPPYVECDYVI